MTENEISNVIFNSALEVHRLLGIGLLENAYERCLAHEISLRGLKVERQVPLSLIYKDMNVELAYRADIIVEDKVIIEVKAVSELSDIHFAQLLSYLKLSDYKLGMLINFNVLKIKDGIRRVVNGLEE